MLISFNKRESSNFKSLDPKLLETLPKSRNLEILKSPRPETPEKGPKQRPRAFVFRQVELHGRFLCAFHHRLEGSSMALDAVGSLVV